jgi:regulatory protein
MKRPAPSLQSRALGWLAQREHSRSELRRKLLRAAQAQARAEAALDDAGGAGRDAAGEGAGDAAADMDGLAAQVDTLLDTLQAKGLLSEQRFVESRVRQRSAGMGAVRIQRELAQHGLSLPPQALQQLRGSELKRAAELCRRRFAGPPADARERARRMRFLAGRGFSGDVIRRALSGAEAMPDDEPPAD